MRISFCSNVRHNMSIRRLVIKRSPNRNLMRRTTFADLDFLLTISALIQLIEEKSTFSRSTWCHWLDQWTDCRNRYWKKGKNETQTCTHCTVYDLRIPEKNWRETLETDPFKSCTKFSSVTYILREKFATSVRLRPSVMTLAFKELGLIFTGGRIYKNHSPYKRNYKYPLISSLTQMKSSWDK